ncbi:MAG: hypothetical protein ABR543_14455 [Gemmatimonadaceae bacterium]
MRFIPCLLVAVVVAACAPKDNTDAMADSAMMDTSAGETTEARRAAMFAGTWEGRSYRTDSDSGVAWANVVTVDADGKANGSLTFKGSSMAPVAMRAMEMTDSSVVWEMGPYTSPTTKSEVTTRTEARVAGDSLWGTFEATPTKGGDKIRGRISAKRTSPRAM